MQKTTNSAKKNVGIILILTATIFWAVEPILAKLSYQNADYLQTSLIRAIGMSFVGFIYMMYTSKDKNHLLWPLFIKVCDKKQENSRNSFCKFFSPDFGFRISNLQLVPALELWRSRESGCRFSENWFWIVILAVTFIADILYFYGLTIVPVLNAVIIAHLQPIFIVVVGIFVLREDKLTKYDYSGITLLMGAGFLVSTKTTENFRHHEFGTIGDAYVLAATIIWAISAIIVRKYLRQVNAGILVLSRYGIGSLALLPFVVLYSSPKISNIYQISVGIVVGIGAILYFESLKRIKAAQVSAFELATPFWAAVLAFFILRETATILQILGMFLLIGGIGLLSKKEENLL